MVKRDPKTQWLSKYWYFRYSKLINVFTNMHLMLIKS
jgi:transcription initiation factor IIE alpha subunit